MCGPTSGVPPHRPPNVPRLTGRSEDRAMATPTGEVACMPQVFGSRADMGAMSAVQPATSGREQLSRGWVDRWLAACSDLAELERSNPMTDAVIEDIDGRMIRIGDKWLADFASCNYLGFDLEREIIEAVPAYLDRWGTHPSWSRLLGSPVLYEQIEERLAKLL